MRGRWCGTVFSQPGVLGSLEVGGAIFAQNSPLLSYKCQRPNQVGDESAISDRTLLRDETRQMGLALVVTLLPAFERLKEAFVAALGNLELKNSKNSNTRSNSLQSSESNPGKLRAIRSRAKRCGTLA
jgi:hypothetical protein